MFIVWWLLGGVLFFVFVLFEQPVLVIAFIIWRVFEIRFQFNTSKKDVLYIYIYITLLYAYILYVYIYIIYIYISYVYIIYTLYIYIYKYIYIYIYILNIYILYIYIIYIYILYVYIYGRKAKDKVKSQKVKLTCGQ